MLLMALGLYTACCLAFYLQLLLHHKLHERLEIPVAPIEAEIIELFPESVRQAA